MCVGNGGFHAAILDDARRAISKGASPRQISLERLWQLVRTVSIFMHSDCAKTQGVFPDGDPPPDDLVASIDREHAVQIVVNVFKAAAERNFGW